MIRHCTGIGFCKKIISLIKSHLAEATIKNKDIKIVIKEGGIPEQADLNAYSWVQNFVQENIHKPKADKLLNEFKEIKKDLKNRVNRWHDNFIQYNTTPKIDDYFDKLAYHSISSEYSDEEFSWDAKFGGIKYGVYCEFVRCSSAVALKHQYFCQELLEKEKDINPMNIFTIPVDRKNLIKSLSKYLEISENDSEQILDCITLSPENYKYHTSIPGGISPPYISIGENSLAHSIIGSTYSPIEFLNKELKRKFEKDYFNAVNLREKKFRDELYNFFSESVYLKSESSVNIKFNNSPTDIDAVIYDSDSNVLGLFQLKWQDMFGLSLKERNSRICNLYPKVNKWLDKTEGWLKSTNKEHILKKLGFKVNKIPSKIFTFVICRHNVFFTGFTPDKRAAWTTIWHMLKIISKKPDLNVNKIEILHRELKKMERKVFETKINIKDEEFKIDDYSIKLSLKQKD